MLLLCAGVAPVADARTLDAGPGQEHADLAAALRAAGPGDTVRIAAGTHYACAVVTQDRLVLEGAGKDATVLTDTMCEGKASLVIRGRDVTVRALGLARARVADGNGAGIRAEGADLRLEGIRFEDNQVGILAGGIFGGTLRVKDCVFVRNGNAAMGRPAAVIVDGASVLEVVDSSFEQGRAGAAIVSSAGVTRIRGGVLRRPASSPSATVQVSGGLVMEDAAIEASPGPGGQDVGVLAFPDGAEDAVLELRGNRLEGGGLLLLNWSGRDAVLADNRLEPGAELSSTAGAWLYRGRGAARGIVTDARRVAAAVRRGILKLWR